MITFPTIRLTVVGPPPRKNARGTIAKGRRITPKKTREWYGRFDEAWLNWLSKPGLHGSTRSGVTKGRACVSIKVYESRLRHLPDVSVPMGDVDSSVSAILDAMQRGARPMIDDDARIVRLEVEKRSGWTDETPRVEIEVEPW